MVQSFVQHNFVLIVNVIFLSLFLMTNTLLERKVLHIFGASLLLLVMLTVVENIELVTASFSYPTMLRVWMSIIGYSIRPLIIYELILIVESGRGTYKKLLAIPAIVNMMVAFSALFCDIAFSYDAENKFVRGPLGIVPYICSIFYFAIILMFSIRTFSERCYVEAIIILAIVVACGVSAGLETAWKLVGLLRTTIGLSITFFYLYLHAQTFKRDALTRTLNRRCFHLDVQRYRDKIAALISVDLNNLKGVNDNQGHSEGDRAICTVVGCMKKCLLRGCILYRTGGDEFVILCLKDKRGVWDDMVKSMKSAMKETPYNCAFGLAERKPGESFEDLYARADAEMYEEKARFGKNRVKVGEI